MPCYSIRKGGKHVGFICGQLGPHCADCGSVGDSLCDYPVGHGKTCDRPMCGDHAAAIGPDIHYCASHLEQWKRWRAGGGEAKELSNVCHFPEKRGED